MGKSPRDRSSDEPSANEQCDICPRSIVEAMLFVGRADGEPLSAREMAAAMRDVSPTEVEAVVAEVNNIYRNSDAPHHIVGSSDGYRMELREEFAEIVNAANGRGRESSLSTSSVEVLSLVAYHQPITIEQVNAVRGTSSSKLLNRLVRLELIRIDRPADRPRQPDYYTTDRFLKLIGIGHLDELPRSKEFTTT